MTATTPARFLVTGSRGQLASALGARIPSGALSGFDLPEVDIREASAVREAVAQAEPTVVIHCAAMTDVDGCARDPALANEVNAAGTAHVADAAAAAGADLVYVSTNEVFDGISTRPYAENDATNPINTYGRSKLAGEILALRHQPRCWIVRTAWLYGSGGANFIHKVQRIADERGSLRVVTDEFSSPTWTEDLAAAILKLVARAPHGLYHLAGLGGCSRYELARAVLEITGRTGVRLLPITSVEWVRASKPPLRTVLDVRKAAAAGVSMRPWRTALEEFLGSAGGERSR